MTRTWILVAFLALAVGTPATTMARTGGQSGRKVKARRPVKKIKKYPRRYRVRVRKASTRKLVRKRPTLAKKRALKKVRKAKRLKKAKRQVRRSKRRVVKLSLKRFSRAERRQMMTLMNSKRVRSSRSAQKLVAEFIRLRSVSKGGKGMPMSIKGLKTLTRSSRWTSRHMANFAKVLRLARYIARRDGVSVEKAFRKAMKKAGVYKKFKRGKCKA